MNSARCASRKKKMQETQFPNATEVKKVSYSYSEKKAKKKKKNKKREREVLQWRIGYN